MNEARAAGGETTGLTGDHLPMGDDADDRHFFALNDLPSFFFVSAAMKDVS